MNPFEMVVLIVLIVTIGRVVAVRMGAPSIGERRAQRLARRQGAIGVADAAADAEAARLRGEVTRLNERIQVLERLATDPAKRLSDEIDSLKNQ
jgi:hypothetical protein